ncbi:MAG: cyanophycin synthetase [Clostridium sp.]|nr:cyanophycin synthetase [Clostridium sp.]
MKIINQTVFEGRNIYSHKKCIRLDLDLCGYSEIPSKDIEGFNSKLISLIPELKKHRCGIDEEGGFVKRLKEGTYLAHISEHIIIALQNMLGVDIAYGKAREIKGELYYIIFQYEYKQFALEVARFTVDIINSLIYNEDINFEGRIKILKSILRREVMGPSTKAIKNAANRYGMPVFPLGNSGFYQIGYGKQGRVIEATIGAQTTCVAADIASDKELTKKLLINQSIPVAKGKVVENVIDLIKTAEEIGYPLVLKPRYGSKGKGVSVNIKSKDELIKKYNNLKGKFEDLILEKYYEGNDYRVCVVDYNIVAASLRIPPYVVGDGISNIKDLIRKLNDDKLRGYDHEKPLTKVHIDEELVNFLEAKGMTLNTVLEKDEKINLRDNANLSTGGMAIDCTNEISEENKKICIRAAKAIGLDICGVDIKTTNLRDNLCENGIVMEINAAPGIRMHMYPSKGKVRDVGEAILALQYNGIPMNIPVISITGTNGKTTTTRLTSYVLKCMGYKVGMTSTDGIFIDGECIDNGDDTGYFSAKGVLLNKDVEVAVLETARGGLIRRGLAYDLADVAAITNITQDHIGLDGINSMEDLAKAKALVGEAVKEDGYVVINADDYWCRSILDRIKAKKVFFSKSKDNELIQKNIREGNIAVYIEDGVLTVTNDYREYKVIELNRIKITLGGILEFNIENAMAACGILVALGVDYCMIAKGFRGFKLDAEYNSGRFNMYDLDGKKVILDYGHNIEGYRSIIKSLKLLKKKKIIGVIGVPGDREDCIIRDIGNLCTEVMDEIIIKEDIDKRGRKEGEVASLLEEGIKDAGMNKYKIILDEREAFEEALKRGKRGDCIVIFYEKLKPLEDIILKHNNNPINENIAGV